MGEYSYINRTFEEIKEIFDASGIKNFEKMPEERSEKRKFAKAFNQFDAYLQAAKIQGFNWKQSVYPAEDGTDIEMLFDEMTYLILLARYKEMASGDGGGRGEDIPYDVKIHITEYDTAKIDHFDSFAGGDAESALMIPLKNMVNDVYTRRLSAGRSSLLSGSGQKTGDFLPGNPPYGYIKSKER